MGPRCWPFLDESRQPRSHRSKLPRSVALYNAMSQYHL